MNTLEVLKAAEQRLANPDLPYRFEDWCACTCGHIYAASNDGVPAATWPLVTRDADPEGSYVAALRAVIEANPDVTSKANARGYHDDTGDPLAYLVSAMTGVDCDDMDTDEMRRANSLPLVRNAIAMLEARYEQDRLNVLAQTERIVNAAAEPAVVA